MNLQNPKTILVVQIGKIGDIILTTPLFSEIKRLFPGSRLVVLVSEVNKDIALNNDFIDEVIVYHKNFLKNRSLLKLWSNLDIWIDTKDNYSKTSGILLKLFRPGISLGFNKTKRIFDIDLGKYLKGNHAVDINLSPVEYLENKSVQSKPKLSFNIPEPIKKKFNSLFKDLPATKIVINVSAGNGSRYLTKEQWVDAINRINSKYLSTFILIGLERDRSRINYIKENTKGIDCHEVSTKNILEVAEVVRRSDVIISADTSVVHICSAFNKPIIAMYPNVKWNLTKFAPLSEYNRVIVSKNEQNIHDITMEEIADMYFELREEIFGGNAESRTRVRKEDH